MQSFLFLLFSGNVGIQVGRVFLIIYLIENYVFREEYKGTKLDPATPAPSGLKTTKVDPKLDVHF